VVHFSVPKLVHFKIPLTFALDESLAMKRHYQYLLAKTQNSQISSLENGLFDHKNASIIRLHMILGDLHFHDEEYNDSILLYTNASEIFKSNIDNVTKDYEMFIVYVKLLLKLGLAYEKIKDHDHALQIYKYSNDLINSYVDNIKNKSVNLYVDDEALLKRIYKNTPKSNKKLMTENFILLQQPLLSLLYIYEKAIPGGLNEQLLLKALFDFEKITESFSADLHNIFLTIFLRQVANIMFFKNRNLLESFQEKKRSKIQDQKCALNFNSACEACFLYFNNIEMLIGTKTELNLRDKLQCNMDQIGAIKPLMKGIREIYAKADNNYTLINEIAHNLRLLSNCILGCTKYGSSELSKEIIDKLTLIESSFETGKENAVEMESVFEDLIGTMNKNISSLDTSLLLSYWAAVLFRSIGAQREESSQYVSILFVLNRLPTSTYFSVDTENLISRLVKRAIRCYHRAYSHIHRVEIAREKDCFVEKELNDKSMIELGNLTLACDIQEITCLSESIILKNHITNYSRELEDKSEKLADNRFFNSFSLSKMKLNARGPMTLITNRIFEMELKSYYNYSLFRIFGFDPLFKSVYAEYCLKKKYDELLLSNSQVETQIKIDKLLKDLTLKRKEFADSLFVNAKKFSYGALEAFNSFYNKDLTEELTNLSLVNESYHNLFPDKTVPDSEKQYIKMFGKVTVGDFYFNDDNDRMENMNNRCLRYFIEYCITDSIFSLQTAIRHLMILGVSYKYQYSYIANLCYHMGTWCNFLACYMQYLDDLIDEKSKETLEKKAVDMKQNAIYEDSRKIIDELKTIRMDIQNKLLENIGRGNDVLLSPSYYYELSLDYYYKSFRVHQEGDTYKELIQNNHIITGDIDSDIAHFAAGLERFVLSKDDVAKRIGFLHNYNRKSEIYELNAYRFFR